MQCKPLIYAWTALKYKSELKYNKSDFFFFIFGKFSSACWHGVILAGTRNHRLFVIYTKRYSHIHYTFRWRREMFTSKWIQINNNYMSEWNKCIEKCVCVCVRAMALFENHVFILLLASFCIWSHTYTLIVCLAISNQHVSLWLLYSQSFSHYNLRSSSGVSHSFNGCGLFLFCFKCLLNVSYQLILTRLIQFSFRWSVFPAKSDFVTIIQRNYQRNRFVFNGILIH